MDKFEKKIKAFLPYIIIIGAVYLIVPALLFINNGENLAINLPILVGVLPLTALGCNFFYAYKKEYDFFLTLVAPAIYLPVMFIYPIFRSGPLVAIIYLVAYFVAGYLGMTLGDLLSPRKKSKKNGDLQIEEEAASRRGDRRPRSAASKRPKRVAVDKEEEQPFLEQDPLSDISLDTATTDDDIDAILSEIHSRKS